MPKVSWKEIDDIIHECKGELQKVYLIEIKCKDLRTSIGSQLEKLQDIVLEQANGE